MLSTHLIKADILSQLIAVKSPKSKSFAYMPRAIRNIVAGEELTFDYGKNYWKADMPAPSETRPVRKRHIAQPRNPNPTKKTRRGKGKSQLRQPESEAAATDER